MWSATAVKDDPDLVREVHKQFIESGADISISAAYKSTTPVFIKALGLSQEEASKLAD